MTEGAVRLDGTDVRQVTQESSGGNVGVVQQDVFLFAASILENIRYGRPGATEEEVARAARSGGNLRRHLRHARRVQHLRGERGVLLSGGQKQRISIAASS